MNFFWEFSMIWYYNSDKFGVESSLTLATCSFIAMPKAVIPGNPIEM